MSDAAETKGRGRRAGRAARLFVIMAAAAGMWPARGETNVPVESRAYEFFEQLQASGLLPSGSLTGRPFSRRRAARLVVEAQREAGAIPGGDMEEATVEAAREFAAEIEEEEAGGSERWIKPLESARLSYTLHDRDWDPYNDRGREYHEGSNVYVGGGLGFRKWKLSGSLYWEGRWLERDAGGEAAAAGRVEEAVLKLGLRKWYVEAGRESLWWGPGRHGSLLLSNNARPFDLVRVGTEEPLLAPGLLSFVGLVNLEAFMTRLEVDRAVPEPYLLGMRFSCRPTPGLELGLMRTAMFGGEGREATLSTLWDVITARNENTPGQPGNQLASAYICWDTRLWGQPVRIYGELGGEDQADPVYFTKQALLAGVYLPEIGGNRRITLRAEYADTYMGGHGGADGVWYNHSIYTSGYTYYGRIMGHHMGTDARDLFIELGIEAGDRVRFRLGYDYEERELSQAYPEERREYSFGMGLDFGERNALEVTCAAVETRNAGLVEGAETRGGRISVTATWRY
ncbi:MAG: hypothetical protein JW909_09750 [Planctomycetes bacterium]|nr:hypothetical protein [Planctomycetota bacterium]